MKYLSVCSGIEAATVAWHPLGWDAIAFSEIEKFPSQVLSTRYPETPNFGDMTKFKEWPDADVDLLVGGTPCQSFSVAGLRKGLADPRGNLMLTYLAIADRYRPRWLVWENVPGVLSSNGGRDFGTFLGGLGQLGYGFAYRVLDAQYVRVESHSRAVPQRRRRVFVVGCLGDWRRAAAVLFERESLCRNNPPSRKTGESVAGTIAKESFSGGAGGRPEGAAGNHFIAVGVEEVSAPLGAGDGSRGWRNDIDQGSFIPQVAGTMPAAGATERKHGHGLGQQEWESGYVVPVSQYGDIAGCLSARNDGSACADRGPSVVAFQPRFVRNGRVAPSEIASPLTAEAGKTGKGDSAQVIAFSCKDNGRDANGEITPTLRSMTHSESHQNGGGQLAVALNMQVRRLTPTECERLQGFPDGYTDISTSKCRTADGPRYKALGNSMAVNCMRWIGDRIQAVETIPNTVKVEEVAVSV